MKGFTHILVKDLCSHLLVASYTEVSENFPFLPNEQYFSDGTYCRVTRKAELVTYISVLLVQHWPSAFFNTC